MTSSARSVSSAPMPRLSRSEALAQIAIAVLLLMIWLLGIQESGLGAWLSRSLGGGALIAAVALQGVPALLLVAALLRWHREPWSAIGLGPAPFAGMLGRGLLTAAFCYAVQPLVLYTYLSLTGQDMLELASNKINWLSAFGRVPVAAVLPLALFVSFYEEILFRGFLQSRLVIALGADDGARAAYYSSGHARAAAVILLSALLFGAGHSYQGSIGIVQTTAIGLVLGTATYLTRSLWPAIVAHAAIDIIGLISAKYLAPYVSDTLRHSVNL